MLGFGSNAPARGGTPQGQPAGTPALLGSTCAQNVQTLEPANAGEYRVSGTVDVERWASALRALARHFPSAVLASTLHAAHSARVRGSFGARVARESPASIHSSRAARRAEAHRSTVVIERFGPPPSRAASGGQAPASLRRDAAGPAGGTPALRQHRHERRRTSAVENTGLSNPRPRVAHGGAILLGAGLPLRRLSSYRPFGAPFAAALRVGAGIHLPASRFQQRSGDFPPATLPSIIRVPCAGVAQLVRAPDCGSGGRGFEPHPWYQAGN